MGPPLTTERLLQVFTFCHVVTNVSSSLLAQACEQISHKTSINRDKFFYQSAKKIMAETLLSVVAEGILSKVLSLAAEELSLAWGFEDELKRLRQSLEMIQALLSDAERKKLTSQSVQVWLKNLDAIALDADATLDEFSYEVLRRKVENRKRDKVRDLFSPSRNKVSFRLSMAHKIKNINTSLDKICGEATAPHVGLVMELLSNKVDDLKEIRETHPYVDDSQVIGREKDMSVIVDMLLNPDHDEEDLSVVAIVGMAGQGKTTLAQLVYKNRTVTNRFDQRVWVCVSDDFEVKRILNEMVQSLTKTNMSPMSNVEALVKKLEESLKGKRYLLVLDDIWNKNSEKWDRLRNSLLGIGGSRGSKIVVTTRSDEVVSTMHEPLTHRLKGLSDADSRALFEKRAFAPGGAIKTDNLVAIGEKIVSRCGGVPLAIKAAGGLLHSKKNESEWSSIQHNQIWDSLENESEFLPSLKLSYDHLSSSSLKHCFAYCSIFPKDSDLGKDNLIQLWMALGLLHPPKGSRLLMENVGEYYFNTLCLNSLLQDTEKDEYEIITSCKMHDLVHDLALHTSKNYRLTLEAGDENLVDEVVHLSLSSGIEQLSEISKASFRRLKTLFFNGCAIGNMLPSFNYLRVLVLGSDEIKELPSSIGRLKHLRYVDISETDIAAVPPGITKLYNLQTLRLYDLQQCPQNITNLINLRHIYIKDLEMSDDFDDFVLIGVRHLTCLQTLPLFVVNRDKGCEIQELGSLENLKGELDIYGLENVANAEEAGGAILSSKSNICALGFHWSDRDTDQDLSVEERNEEDVLESLKPHSNLKGLTITNFAGRNFPSWMRMESQSSSLPIIRNLVKIELVNCKRCDRIPTLGHLPYLKVVSIKSLENVKSIGKEFYGTSIAGDGASSSTSIGVAVAIFPALRELSLVRMPELEDWLEAEQVSPSREVFPNLEVLKIEGCNSLTSAPSHFPFIKKLSINGINNSMALKKISSKLTSLTSLSLVNIKGSEVQIVVEELLGSNRSLKNLNICDCEDLSYLPNGLQNHMALEIIQVVGCHSLLTIPAPSSLQTLYVSKCDKLTSVDNLCSSLRALSIEDCKKFIGVPSEVEACTSMTIMLFKNCPAVVSLPNLQRLARLTELTIGGFSNDLDYFPWPYYSFASTSDISRPQHDDDDGDDYIPHQLRTLSLYGWPKLKSLPKQLQHLSTLTELWLIGFDELEALPEWLSNLSSLQRLVIWYCKKLKELPTVEGMRRLTKLQTLDIQGCPLLEERCTEGTGSEWNKIAHIPG